MYKRVEFAICNYLLKEVRSAGNSGGVFVHEEGFKCCEGGIHIVTLFHFW